MSHLRIGISACFFHADPKRPIFKGKTLLYLEESMSKWVARQGVLAYLIPAAGYQGIGPSLEDLVTDLDGLVLQGGSDVSPKSYGETPLKPEWSGDYIRDGYEIALIKEFCKQRKPVLGICRGLQLMNVAFGGTLYQDIGQQLPKAQSHREWEIYDQHFHNIDISQGSRLFPGQNSAKVNSVHHQAIKDLGQDLVVEAVSQGDQVIEAIRHSKMDFVAAVQWHPEFHDAGDPTVLDGTPLLTSFLTQAQARKNEKRPLWSKS